MRLGILRIRVYSLDEDRSFVITVHIDKDSAMPDMGSAWVTLIEKVGLIGAIFAGFFYVVVRYLIPAFMSEIEKSRDLLAKQADKCNQAQDEQLKQFTSVMNAQQQIAMQAILKLDTLTKAIDKQSQVIDSLVRYAEASGFVANPAVKPGRKRTTGGKL